MYKYDLKSIGNVEVKEFMLESDGYKIIGFLGKGNYFNWLSLPQRCISVELSKFNDNFWNREKLSMCIEDPFLIDLLLKVLHDLACFFGIDEQDCFDGKNFITTREYTFWLECECESLSRQLIQSEKKILPSRISHDELNEDRLNYYIYSREQYGTDKF